MSCFAWLKSHEKTLNSLQPVVEGLQQGLSQGLEKGLPQGLQQGLPLDLSQVVTELKSQISMLVEKHKLEIDAAALVKQQLEIAESCLKAELLHMKLSYQEDLNDKALEIKSLKTRMLALLSKTTEVQ